MSAEEPISKKRPHKSRKLNSQCVNRIRANRSRQVPTNSYSPLEYYEDQRLKCRDCRKEFIFTALEQQAWYEEYGIPHHATRVRCQHCSKKYNACEVIKKKYDTSCAAAKRKDAGYNTLIEAGLLAVELFQASSKRMSIEHCIGWLKKCLKLKPSSREPLYLLACCYEYAGNSARALEKYETFLEKTCETRRGDMKAWRGLAEKRVRELSAD